MFFMATLVVESRGADEFLPYSATDVPEPKREIPGFNRVEIYRDHRLQCIVMQDLRCFDMKYGTLDSTVLQLSK